MTSEFIWVVSYCESGTEPVVTAFNNEEAANKYYEYLKKGHELCCLDKCLIYSHFLERSSEET